MRLSFEQNVSHKTCNSLVSIYIKLTSSNLCIVFVNKSLFKIPKLNVVEEMLLVVYTTLLIILF